MRRSVSANYGNISIKQLRCFLCSICLVVTCVLFSSLFITSSLSEARATGIASSLNYRRKRTLTSNYTIRFGEDGHPTFSKTTNPSATKMSGTEKIKVRTTIQVANPSRNPSSGFDRNPTPHSRKSKLSDSAYPGTTATERTSSEFLRVKKLCGKSGIKRIVHDNFRYLINEENLCSGLVYLIIAVHSKPSYRYRRDLIRQTWGSVRYYNGERIKVVFFLAKTKSHRTTEEVRNESKANRDIIQRDFMDHYRNLTHKHLTVMRWVSDYCHNASYLIKVDDDTFINIFHLVQMLKTVKPQNFMCKVVTGAAIRSSRSSLGKWAVTKEEYPHKRYPYYCEGFAYLVRANLARYFHWCSQFTKFFWIDDIFISGILANKLKVSREGLWLGHAWAENIPSLASEKMMDYVFVRTGNNQIMPDLWMRFWRACLHYSH